MGNKVVLLPFNESFGGGEYYELIPFTPKDHPEQEGCFLLKPVKEPNLNKMTKQQLIDYIKDKES